MTRKIHLFTFQTKFYFLELDLDTGEIQKRFSPFQPKNPGGQFFLKGEDVILLYGKNNNLYFRVNDQTVLFEEGRIKTVFRSKDRNANFQFFHDGNEIFSCDYKLKDPVEDMGYDEFIEDFFFYIHRLVNDPKGWRQIYQQAF